MKFNDYQKFNENCMLKNEKFIARSLAHTPDADVKNYFLPCFRQDHLTRLKNFEYAMVT